MEALELRHKLINQFQTFIEDDAKLEVLSGVFDALTTFNNTNSFVSEEHYKIVEERRQKKINGQTQGKNWEEAKILLQQKYGF